MCILYTISALWCKDIFVNSTAGRGGRFFNTKSYSEPLFTRGGKLFLKTKKQANFFRGKEKFEQTQILTTCYIRFSYKSTIWAIFIFSLTKDYYLRWHEKCGKKKCFWLQQTDRKQLIKEIYLWIVSCEC